ncbi:MAG: Gx transporter family protein [Sulfuriflexus sp.]|nr:Gx transporter family protein [Sulfuriflexus sp.]MDT8403135.1 Gx transporter family protein [Sulfuriflexus sp.]
MTASPGLSLQANRDDLRIAGFAALAIVIHLAESALPTPLPGFKPGFANIISLYVLLAYGWRMAAWVSLLRVLGGSLLLGTFLSPTFMLSLSGALASLAVLAVSIHLPGRPFGPVGHSCLAALAHMSGQFFAAYSLFMPHPALLLLLPVLLTAALLSGIVGGIITHKVMQQMQEMRST